MDYKSKLIRIIDYISVEEDNFINNLIDKKEAFLDCYDNWTFKDVVSHISEWRILSAAKLKLVKNNKYVSFHEDLDVFNRLNYEKHRNDLIEDVKLLSMTSCHVLKNQIELFHNSELMGESKIDGFKSSLWKYILIDSFMHPTIHMVFYYIKVQEFERAFKILQNNYILLLELDNSQEMIIDFFSLGEVAEELDHMNNKNRILFNLKNFYERNKYDKIVSSLVLDRFITTNNMWSLMG